MVTCQDEKSQHKNKAKAMKVLRSRLLDLRIAEEQAKHAAERAQSYTGERNERIRTYNFPQNRVSDHRSNSRCTARCSLWKARLPRCRSRFGSMILKRN